MSSGATWVRVDGHLYCGERLKAILAAREDLQLPLRDGIYAVQDRWVTLTSASPDRLHAPLDGY